MDARIHSVIYDKKGTAVPQKANLQFELIPNRQLQHVGILEEQQSLWGASAISHTDPHMLYSQICSSYASLLTSMNWKLF